MNKKIEELVTEAKALGAKEAQEHNAEPQTRKIRFCADDATLGDNNAEDGLLHNVKTDKFFAPKRNPESYDFESIALGRMLLGARGAVLPDNLESKFQSQADRVRKLTMTTDAVGTGAELTDVVMWPNLFNDVVANTLVAQLFAPWITMSAKSMELPSLGDATFYTPSGEGEAVTATDLATAKRTITAYLLKAQVDVSDEEDEDAIIALLPEIRSKLVRNSREVIDETLLCADASDGATNINYYGADIAADSRFLLGFDGLIHLALNEITGNVDAISAAIDAADFRTLLGHMGKYADDPTRVAFIIDRWNKNVMLGLTELGTVDKYGPAATILTGEIGKIYGSPVIVSSALAKAASDGRVNSTGGSNTTGRIIAVNRDMWRFGIRRAIRIAAERSEAKGITSVVATLRIGLQCFGDRSSAGYTHTILGRNCTI